MALGDWLPHPHRVCMGIALPGTRVARHGVYVSGVHLAVELPAPKVRLFIAAGAIRPLPRTARPAAVCGGLRGFAVTVTLCDPTAGQRHPRVAPSTPSDFPTTMHSRTAFKSRLVFSLVIEVITRSEELKS